MKPVFQHVWAFLIYNDTSNYTTTFALSLAEIPVFISLNALTVPNNLTLERIQRCPRDYNSSFLLVYVKNDLNSVSPKPKPNVKPLTFSRPSPTPLCGRVVLPP